MRSGLWGRMASCRLDKPAPTSVQAGYHPAPHRGVQMGVWLLCALALCGAQISPDAYMAYVVFAGYGITSTESHYDDYAGLDVSDKVVLIMRHEPQESAHKEHDSFSNKATNAKMHGARGVILVNDFHQHAEAL